MESNLVSENGWFHGDRSRPSSNVYGIREKAETSILEDGRLFCSKHIYIYTLDATISNSKSISNLRHYIPSIHTKPISLILPYATSIVFRFNSLLICQFLPPYSSSQTGDLCALRVELKWKWICIYGRQSISTAIAINMGKPKPE
jgi:hypothetical protein